MFATLVALGARLWSSQGATVVRWERAAGFLVTSLGLGSVLPLLGSATGNVFLAWNPAYRNL